MPEEPPPLPQASRKRILPAFLLCFVLPVHRIYAGRYVSGIVQVVWMAAASLWAWTAYGGLLAIVNSAPLTVDTVMDMSERLGDWEEKNHPSLIPVLALLIVGIWIAIDAMKLIARKFTDGEGRKITKWI